MHVVYQGFDVGVYYDLSRYGMIKSIDFEDYTEDITYCTELAIRHYNTTEVHIVFFSVWIFHVSHIMHQCLILFSLTFFTRLDCVNSL